MHTAYAFEPPFQVVIPMAVWLPDCGWRNWPTKALKAKPRWNSFTSNGLGCRNGAFLSKRVFKWFQVVPNNNYTSLKLTGRTCQDAPFQKEINLPNIYFQVPFVSFREGIVIKNTHKNIPPRTCHFIFLKNIRSLFETKEPSENGWVQGIGKPLKKNLLETIDHEGVPDVEEPPPKKEWQMELYPYPSFYFGINGVPTKGCSDFHEFSLLRAWRLWLSLVTKFGRWNVKAK